jgi:hypothetical protein
MKLLRWALLTVALDAACDLTTGRWVRDDAYKAQALAQYAQCPNSHAVRRSGRTCGDAHLSWRWRPAQCKLPPLEVRWFQHFTSTHTISFVGDSLAGDQFTSLDCLLAAREAFAWKREYHKLPFLVDEDYYPATKPGTAFLRSRKAEAALCRRSYRRRVITSNCTIDAVVVHLKNAHRITQYARSFRRVLVLNAGHHFGHEKLNVYFNYSSGPSRWSDLVLADKKAPQGDERHPSTAWEAALATVLRATQAPRWNSFTVLQTVSPTHYERGGWRDGGRCAATEPSSSGAASYAAELDAQRRAAAALLRSAKSSKNHVRVLDVFNVSALRPDAHPGRYGELRPGVRDCSHWCLPGVPDAWNQFLQHLLRCRACANGGKCRPAYVADC